MYSNIILPRQWSRLACMCKYSTAIEGQKLPESSKSTDGISPPARIPRGPTDILQALAATVGNDPTAAHYKYHDDPFLIPLSNHHKRAYALSAEAGRKAAVWVRDEHAELFTTRVWDPPGKKKTPYFNADPKIPAFTPKPIYNNESKVTEDDLKYTIDNALIEDSIKVYQLLGGEDLSSETKLAFLQLLCFYNEKESDALEWIEERWFAAITRERHSTTWKLGGLAEQIFNSLDPKTPEAYCAVIQGMAKYYQAERARQLANEAIEKGITLSTPVYNSLLMCIGFLCEGTALRIEKLDSTLREIIEQGLYPNSGTLTACLKSLSLWGSGRILQQKALNILADFRAIGINPGLSAYYYLLCLFCKERGPRHNILSSILNDLEKREKIEASNSTDTNFFITAMAVCSDHLEDINLAERVHALLMKDDNYRLLGDAYKESIYYRHLVTIACKRAPLEQTIRLLDELIPNIYVPEPSVVERIIETYEIGGLGDRLAQTWSQLVVFGLAKRSNLVERLLNAMNHCYQFQEAEVKIKMREAAIDILKFVNETEEEMQMKDQRTPPKKLSAGALCSAAELCAAAAGAGAAHDAGWAAARGAVARLRGAAGGAGGARAAPLAALAARAAASARPDVAAAVVQFLAEYGYEEATTASVQVLGILLNRPEQEILTLLKQPKSAIANNLDPDALAIVDAYLMTDNEVKQQHRRQPENTSSSDSDSESSDSDREVRK